ncbi:MAG: putative chaperone protein [Cryomorphaceae bacterium]|jgi:hypothetical chaperone protein
MKHVGLDFGTANTSVATINDGQTKVLNLEGQSGSIPSTLFFDFEDNATVFGEAAFERYYFGDRGRFLRSFKSALGTTTIDHTIRIKLNTYSIKDIIQQYIGEVLSRAETNIGSKISNLVVGRPVSFVDDNPQADRLAQAALKDVVSNLGVENIEFQLEPIAAALNYGVTVTGEEVVLVIDIGAGTSDFSVVKFQSRGPGQSLESRVIANCGIHIGGNDFDKLIALNSVMPFFGYQQRFKRRPELEIANSYFLNASSWHRIDLLYDRKVINGLKELLPQVQQPETFARFIELIESRQSHKVLGAVEKTKRQFANTNDALIELSFVDQGLDIEMSSADFQALSSSMCGDIMRTANKAITDAGLVKANIDTVYLTGGSMGIKHLHNMVLHEYPDSKVIEGDRSTAVARGLALDAQRKFA